MGLSSAITADTAHTHADSHILSSNMASPHANTSLRPTPGGADEEALVMLSDALLTGSKCRVQPGSDVAVFSVALHDLDQPPLLRMFLD